VTLEALGLAMPSDQIILFSGWALVISTLISMSHRATSVILVAREKRARQ